MDQNLKTPQELALLFYNIDWTRVQSDDIHACEEVKQYLYWLEKLDKKQAIRVLLEVIEVKSLDEAWPETNSPFKDMKQFNYLNKNINNWPTNEYTELYDDNVLKPSDYSRVHPWDSTTGNSECETTACCIMMLLANTGNEFRPLTFEEYKKVQVHADKGRFNKVIKFCVSADTAKCFSPTWEKVKPSK